MNMSAAKNTFSSSSCSGEVNDNDNKVSYRDISGNCDDDFNQNEGFDYDDYDSTTNAGGDSFCGDDSDEYQSESLLLGEGIHDSDIGSSHRRKHDDKEYRI